MDFLTTRLLNDFQRGLPLTSRPFRALAEQVGVEEPDVLSALSALASRGIVSRVGATFAPGRIGAATLAAMIVPEPRLRQVARLVNSYPEVNHNYEREHRYSLWFVVTASDAARVEAVVRTIELAANCEPVLSLPLVEPYHVNLGFDLTGRDVAPRVAGRSGRARRVELTATDRALVAALQDGLPLVPEPYAALARRAVTSEQEVIATLARWIQDGVISRMGVIVRHRRLGYRANAMVVWDVPDGEVRAVGQKLARLPQVTLCYRRERRPPAWRYNLYCMIHGRSRTHVLAEIANIGACCDLVAYPYDVLFSRRCFKQRGARYVSEAPRG